MRKQRERQGCSRDTEGVPLLNLLCG
jgi:hypothetical protein